MAGVVLFLSVLASVLVAREVSHFEIPEQGFIVPILEASVAHSNLSDLPIRKDGVEKAPSEDGPSKKQVKSMGHTAPRKNVVPAPTPTPTTKLPEDATLESTDKEAKETAEPPKCEPAPTSHLMQYPIKAFPELSDFLDGPGLNATDKQSTAVCKFKNYGFSPGFPHFHFPHAAQQLYACWSWWRAHPTKEPILLFPDDHKKSTFLDGMLDSFRAMNVTIVPNHTDPAVDMHYEGRTPDERNETLAYYAMYKPEHARELADGIHEAFNMAPALASCPTKPDTPPRIAILNRKSRNFPHVEEMAEAVRDATPGVEEVPIAMFETRSFVEQVQFYGDYDIVISPHGAQLTGLVFMRQCSSVLEVFPRGYHWPEYFGSLANVTGLNHGYLYLSDTHWTEDVLWGMSNPRARRRSRSVSLCPELEKVVNATRILIQEWRDCCSRAARER